MRFMTLVKSPEGRQPPPALDEAIAALGREAGKKMLWTGGLTSTKDGAILSLRSGKIRVTDGPFSEAKEVIGGFAVYECESKEDAVEWCRRFLEVHQKHWPEWDGEVELRQLFEAQPFRN
jgi:hypothetical protein